MKLFCKIFIILGCLLFYIKKLSNLIYLYKEKFIHIKMIKIAFLKIKLEHSTFGIKLIYSDIFKTLAFFL